jgi:regulator of protease activity HflC (stomatin/prohibitin superfamily)
MADIKRYPLVRHFRGTPTGHVVHLSGGEVRHDGAGLSFWFRPLSAVLSEVPIDDRELPLLFHARTQDFQDVTVQATVTYRFTDPALVSQRLDFGVDPDTGRWRGTPLDQVARLLTELAASHAIDLLAGMGLAEALVGGIGLVRDSMSTGLAGDTRLASTGITVLAARVAAIRPEADMERALQTPTREQVQADADKATYARRAIAVERERAIAENELASKIELATREANLVTQEGNNQRRRAEEDAAAAAIAAKAAAERTTVMANASAEETRTLGAAQAEAESAKLAAYAGVDQSVLTYLAMRELAGQLPNINSLTITPDLLTGALSGLMAGRVAK